MDPEAVLRKRDVPLFVRRLYDGADLSMVFDQSTGKIYMINEVTRLIWNLSDGRRTWGTILDILHRDNEPGDAGNHARADFADIEIEEAREALCQKNWLSLETKRGASPK